MTENDWIIHAHMQTSTVPLAWGDWPRDPLVGYSSRSGYMWKIGWRKLYRFQSTAGLGSSFCTGGQSGPASVLPMTGISLKYGVRKSPTCLGKGAPAKSIYFICFCMSSRELGSAQRSSMKEGGIKKPQTAPCRIICATASTVGGGGRWR